MTLSKIIFMVGGLAVMLGLAGCKQRDPRDIAVWKAEGNTRKLISAIDDERQFVRLDAIGALAELKATEAIDPLAALFSDPDLVIVHKAIDAVASMEDPQVEKHMLKALDLKTVPARITAATTLGRLKSNAAVDPLIALLDNDHESVAVAAATALGQIGNPKAIGALSETVNARSFNIRMAGVSSLGQIGGTESAKALEPAMGNLSDKIRSGAIDGLVKAGSASAPLALSALRSENHFARESGMAVLQGLKEVPTDGSDLVWYRLARLTAGENPVVAPYKDTGLAHTDNIEPLVEALVHGQREIRDYALLALTAIGEPAAAPVLASAEQVTDPEAKSWLGGRRKWPGAPDWRIDLWAAAAALDPEFNINTRIAAALRPHTHASDVMMRSQEFKLKREYIPLLIIQFASPGSEYSVSHTSLFGINVASRESNLPAGETQTDAQRIRKCRLTARKALVKADYWATLPLLAALNDEDLDIAAYSAQTLLKICGDRALEPVVATFSSRIDKGTELSGTAFQKVMQEIGTPEIEALLLKVRPNITQAIRTAAAKYPGTEFSNILLLTEVDPKLKAAPFRLAYFVGTREKELRVIFRPDENGDWVPTPPLPDSLPQ